MRCVNTPSATVAAVVAVAAAASAAAAGRLTAAATVAGLLKLGSWRGLRATGTGLTAGPTALDVPSPPSAGAGAGAAVPGATAAELRDETRGAALS